MSPKSYYPAHYIYTRCCIIERIADLAFRAELPNGKETVAFLQKNERHLSELIEPQAHVHVRICPADLDQARIMSLV